MSNKKKQRGWLVTTALSGGVLAYVFFVFLPAQKSIAKLRSELTTKQDFILQSENLTTGLHDLEKKLEQSRHITQNWRDNAPAESELAALFGTLTDQVRQAGTTIVRFDPQPGDKLNTLSRVPITLGSKGGFVETIEVIRRLESMPQTIWIRGMNVVPDREDSEVLECELSLAAFVDNRENSD